MCLRTSQVSLENILDAFILLRWHKGECFSARCEARLWSDGRRQVRPFRSGAFDFFGTDSNVVCFGCFEWLVGAVVARENC